MSSTTDNVAKGLPAARRRIYDALREALDVSVQLYGSKPGKHYGANPLVELATLGATGEPDLFELRIWVTCAGDIHRGEALTDDTMQAIEDALPATVGAPEWNVAYDQDAKHWRAEGRSLAFR